MEALHGAYAQLPNQQKVKLDEFQFVLCLYAKELLAEQCRSCWVHFQRKANPDGGTDRQTLLERAGAGATPAEDSGDGYNPILVPAQHPLKILKILAQCETVEYNPKLFGAPQQPQTAPFAAADTVLRLRIVEHGVLGKHPGGLMDVDGSCQGVIIVDPAGIDYIQKLGTKDAGARATVHATCNCTCLINGRGLHRGVKQSDLHPHRAGRVLP